jgi:hypothetical protein
MPPVCDVAASDRPLAITSPINGAHYVLEPYRAAASQRPWLVAVPAAPDLTWTIDGKPAASWIPSPGTHRIVAARAGSAAEVTITYE